MRAERLPGPVEAVLLDAGGVLLDLDYAYLRRLIEARHEPVPLIELSRAEAHARREINDSVNQGYGTAELWRDYFHILLFRVAVPGDLHESIIDSLWNAHERLGLWTTACDGARETVAALKRSGFRLGVVSNAEGRVARDLDNAGFAGMFETVVDSRLVGVAKPDPAIFAIALERMRLRPETTAFVGDLPAVDVRGARSAGLIPILLDRHDLYPDADTLRVQSIGELAALLDLSSGS